jgi:dolichol-phosphate mannosyltransferase
MPNTLALQACIVLPTYNEAATITTVVEQIFAVALKKPNWDVHILVVDDHSPDETAKQVRVLQKRYPDLHLLEGEKQGLGKAYIRGFSWVLEHLPQVTHAFQMDSDLSHDPNYVIDFLTAAEQDSDFVIGSRYIRGGGTPDWQLHRKLLSRWGNLYIRFVGGIRGVHDCTSGYRCIATALLRKIDFDKLYIRGYAFQMTLLDQALKKGAQVKEIPIIFLDRKAGSSKLGPDDTWECLRTASALRLRRY